jgi:guanylate kinase
MSIAVILYGPPAAGKDTITRKLERLSSRYSLFPRLKIGGGRTAGYRITDPAEIERMRAAGDVIWENHRYGSSYFVDRGMLNAEVELGIPVLHLGQAEAINAVRDALNHVRWLVVYVWCPRDVAVRRIEARQTGDTAARMQAWDATPPVPADLTINTAEVAAEAAALSIDRAVTQATSPGCPDRN